MSVIHDAQPNDEIICIREFHASPDGEGFSWNTSRRFRVGERVRYMGFRLDQHFKEQPNGWQVTFETSDGKHYAATQSHFVNVECWQALKRFFAKRLLTEPKRRSQSRP